MYPQAGRKFDTVFVTLGFLLTAGVFLDGWAHNHLTQTLETFFTPWHAIFYGSFFAICALLIHESVKNYKSGFRFPKLLPRQYHLSIYGLAIFLLAGVGDMFWHLIFGIEVDVEALLSPTHLLLALGGAILMCAPFHALWHRDIKEKPHSFAIIFSVIFFFSLLTFMTQFAHPMHHPWMDSNFITNPPDSGQALGVASIMIQSGIFVGLILTILKRWKFPHGSFVLIVGLNAIFMSVLRDQFRFIPALIIAGFIIDLIYKKIDPDISRTRQIRLFSVLAPMVIYSAYTVTIFLTSGTWWSVHLWVGAIAISGIVGFLLSYLAIEPGSGETVG
ncbi:MAG: hypothetical protein AAB503_02080 [Patescibacteria group bacterium]